MNSTDIDRELARLTLTRKAASWKDANTLEQPLPAWASGLQVLQADEVYGSKSWPCADFACATVPQVFILQRPEGRYLVDTQGCNYARYIARLAD
jgi:hypothetical protein